MRQASPLGDAGAGADDCRHDQHPAAHADEAAEDAGGGADQRREAPCLGSGFLCVHGRLALGLITG